MRVALKKLRDSLTPIYGKNETEAIIRIIFHHLKGWSLTDMLIHSEDELSPYIKSEIDKIITRLINYEPIQYITGEARFHGMNLSIKPGVLIPRPETDELTDLIIDENKNKEDLKILDVCTGSGCIAIALYRNLKFPKITAVDISPVALEVAEENAAKLKCDIKFIKADILEWIPDSKYDIIVSNPPYVNEIEASIMSRNVLEYEPHNAIFVPDDDPLKFYKRIISISKSFLNHNGKLYLEINPLYVKGLESLIKDADFKDIRTIKDSFGKDRFMICSF